MMKNWKIIFVCCFFSFIAFSKGKNPRLIAKAKEVETALVQLRSAKADSLLIKYNKQFKEVFLSALNMKGAFNYPFSFMHRSVGDIYSQDHLVRIFSWNVQMTNKKERYFCIILRKKRKNSSHVYITELHREKQNLRSIKNRTIRSNNWYGGLYYDIIDHKRGARTYYTLLCYATNRLDISTKLIDILYFRQGRPIFGKSIFNNGDRNSRDKRILFQYSAKSTMSLKYDPERMLIIFDHLSPRTPRLKGMWAFYTPDFSYDAYAWSGREWVLKEDIIATNKKQSKKFKIEVRNKKTGAVDTLVRKRKWRNPSDPNAPISNGVHQAMTPEKAEKIREKEEKQLDKRRDKKRDRRKKYDKYRGYHYTDYGKD